MHFDWQATDQMLLTARILVIVEAIDSNAQTWSLRRQRLKFNKLLDTSNEKTFGRPSLVLWLP